MESALSPSQTLAVMLAALAAVVFLARPLFGRRPAVKASHVRGRVLTDPRRLRARAQPADPGLQFGRQRIPSRLATGHFAIVGATGSGKTLFQRLLMQSVLPRIGEGRGSRALVYDAKQDVLSLLAGMGLGCPVVTFNPFDARSVAWDMARDITSPAAALQAATLLIPEAKNDSNPFFTNAARQLLHGVIQALVQAAPGAWTLRHVLLLVREQEQLQTLLGRFPQTQHLLQFFDHPATAANIVSTVLTYTAPYEIIAAAWDRATSALSLRQWLAGESVLVLGNDEANRAALDTINRLLFKRVVELVLAGPEATGEGSGRTWFFLDEVREAGRLAGLSSLMTKGRSKGACVVLGFQDINGLRDVYGRNVADELVGQASSKAILRLNTPETAQWASGLFGSREVLEASRGQNRGRNFRDLGLPTGSSAGESLSHAIAKRELVLDSEFLDLPETTPQTGLTGFFLTPATGGFRDHLPGAWLTRHLQPADDRVPNVVPRPESDQYLRPWGADDARVLGPERPPLTLCRTAARRPQPENLPSRR